MRRVAAIGAVLALAACPAALATERHPTGYEIQTGRGHLSLLPSKPKPRASQADLEGEIMCPVCSTTLDQSDSPIARQMKADIARRIGAGDSKSEIKDALVAEFGQQILAAPPAKGFNLLAWLLPFVALFGGALVLGLLAWRWSRDREPPRPAARLSPALERRVDEEIARFDEG
jgi:cytochrome c-type biogenesis protein CcmH